MAGNLNSNPFSGLFTSPNEAATFTHIVASAAGGSSSENSPNAALTDDESYKNKAKEKLEENQMVEEIFCLTINKNTRGSGPLVYLEDVATSVSPQDWIDVETLEQALFERLLLEDPGNCVVSSNVVADGSSNDHSSNSTHATEKLVIPYLFECHKRLTILIPNANCESRKNHISKMTEFVLRNAATALRQPELFEDQNIHLQIMALCDSECNTLAEITLFIHGIAEEFRKEDGDKNSVVSLIAAFQAFLDLLLLEISKASLFTFKQSHFELVHVFSSNSQLALVLLSHCTPVTPTGARNTGTVYANTLLGSMLRISCLPYSLDGMYEYFGKEFTMREVPSMMEENVWRAIQTIQEQLYQIFHSLLKCSATVKHRTLCWLADCLHSNSARGQLWNSHSAYPSPDLALCVSDGFMLNLSGVLLRLCQPFCSNVEDPKLLRIDPTYCAASCADEDEMLVKGVHMKAMADETCLIPCIEDTARPVAESFGFVTECFFLTQRSLDLGFRVVTERVMKLNQDIARMQRAMQDTESQQARPDVRQILQERQDLNMTKYQCFLASLLEPKALSMMAQLHVCTAAWLVQVTLQLDTTPRKAYFPNKFREVKFPLELQMIPLLSCVPEFLIENTCGFLSYIRRFNPQTLESQGFKLLDPILTMLIVFMGSVERMRNPHLRARMAEALEALLPEDKSRTQQLKQSTFYRELLFKHHPHRHEIVVNLLDVFVGIEMTGQSVAFEQKFNYRRPMYIVMEYLWQIEEHQLCFKRLAEEAETHMEDVTPPLFLRFVNLLINDAVFLLDEALTNMAKLKQMQAAREAGEWQQLPAQERQQNEGYVQHIGMIARFDNILGRETIQTLKFLTSKITSIFSHPTMVDRIAAMLNYFLDHLVGPKMKNFKVKDQKEYEFEPANIVLDICTIYVHLYPSDSFCLAVSQDGRSYSPQLFQLAEDVLVRIGGGLLISDLQSVAAKVARSASKQQTEEEILSEAPEEFLDPIMNTLMTDPVILPSSHTTIDRSTIARHLLSDQTDPFNRSALTMDLVKPNDELRHKIEAWIQEKRDQLLPSSSSK